MHDGSRSTAVGNGAGEGLLLRRSAIGGRAGTARRRPRAFLQRVFVGPWTAGVVVPDGSADPRLARTWQKLGPEWRVLDSVIIGNEGREVDHLLIGPTGVYAVNAKHHADDTVCLGDNTLIVNGERVHHVRDSCQEATLVSRLLSKAVGFEVRAKGMVVIVGDRRFDVRHQPREATVYVATPQSSLRWLQRQEVEWTPWGVDRIYDLALRTSTWRDVADTDRQQRPVASVKQDEVALVPSHEPSQAQRAAS